MDLKLNVLLGMIERVTGPLKSITGAASVSAKALRDTKQRLKELEKAQRDLKDFRDLRTGTRNLQRDMTAAQAKATALGKAIAATNNPTRAQQREFNAARKAAASLQQQYQANVQKLGAMRTQLGAAGINTRAMGAAQRTLAGQIGAANAQLSTHQQRLKAIGQARAQMQRTQGIGAHVAVAGAASMAAGHAVIGAIRPQLDEAKAWQQQVAQLRAQGIGDAAVADATKFAQGMQVIGSSATDNLKLVKEAYSVLRDMHESEEIAPYLARMKFGIETVMAQGGHGDGHGDNAEAMFMDLLKVAELRGAAKNPESLKRVLDYSTQAYVASGGLVKPEDLLNMIKTGGVAAKQLDDTSFFFGLLHTMQEMGGHRAGTGLATGYQNWAAGRTTQQAAEELSQLGLLNKDSVKYGKTGHVTKLLPDALKDGELYRSNPFEFLMKRVVPKLNPGGVLNDQQVVSKINALFSGRKGGDLFASLYLERANIAKHLAAAPRAYGVDALYKEAGATAGGQEIELEAKKRDLYRELGTQLLPVYVAGLTKLVALVKRLTAWTQEHPRLAKALTVTAAGFGVLMTAAGGLMIALGGLIAQFGLLRFAAKATGIRFALGRVLGGAAGAVGSTAAAATGAAGGATQVGMLSRVGLAARGVLAGIAGASGATLAIVGAVAVLVIGVALAIRKYWQPIKAWFGGIGAGISEGIQPALERVKDALGPLGTAFAAIGSAIRWVWNWFTRLIEPVQSTQQELAGARESGIAFGRVVGAALGRVVEGVTFGVRMFVALGEAIGNAAGWVVATWQQIPAYFANLWQGVKDAAASAMDWISAKVQAVRSVIERLYAMWQKITGQGGATMGQPMDWIMPNDQDKARRIADAIARNPADGSAAPNASIVRPPRIAAPAPGATYQVHVDARGMSPQEAQAAIAGALRDHERKTQAQQRSAYTDRD